MQEVEDFIHGLPKDERVILRRLRGLILEVDPRIREKLSYGVPYFSRNRRLFFLWPASAIPCLNHRKNKTLPPKVTLGFCYGNLLSNAQGLLIGERRKQVFTVPLCSAADIDDRLFSEVFNEAIIVDQQFFRRNK